MTNEELVDLTNKQYKELLKMQGKAHKKVLKLCIPYINDLERRKIIAQNLAVIDATITTELEEINKRNKIFLESCE